MTAQEYATMFLSLPNTNGLAVIGHAFLQESIEGARALTERTEIENYATQQKQKWAEFCVLVRGQAVIEPQENAFDGLANILLSRKGMM